MKIFGFNIERVSKSKAKRRSYEAADKGRRAKALRFACSSSANTEIGSALTTLRDRSRMMVRNNGWARRAVEAVTKHTIGEGIQPAPLGDLDVIAKVKWLWREWAESTACDWYGRTNFYGIQELIMRSVVEGGDAIVLKRWVHPEEGDILPLKLQILEGDQIDHSKDGENEHGVARLGVQYNKEGILIGYWLYNYHPGDNVFMSNTIDSEFVPKSEVLHIYEVLRIGQCRGIPFGVSTFMKMSDFSDYEDAQLVKQKVAACFAAFVLSSEDTEDDSEHYEALEPGIIEHLTGTESVEFANPPSVGDYDGYSSRLLQGIAAGYGITYEMLTMDYSKVNFTSGRMAKIDVTNNFRSWQYNMIVPQLCQPVWRWFISAAIIMGKLDKPIGADWTAPRVQQLDPTKETDAQIKRIKSGLATISETLREMGREPDEFFAEYQQDVERVERLGINIDSLNL